MKKLTITVSDAMYQALHARCGPRGIGRFLEDLARPHVLEAERSAAYAAMAADEEREQEALDWAEDLVTDVADETR